MRIPLWFTKVASVTALSVLLLAAMRGLVGGRWTGLWLVALVWLAVAAPQGMAQQRPAPPALSFDVATIKPTKPDDPNGNLLMNENKFETEGQTLKSLVKFAYNLNMGADQQIAGGPAWVVSAKFDIQAKEDPDTVTALKKLSDEQQVDAIRKMVRGLLADRFKLKVHSETRVLPVYALVVAKGGTKMTPSVETPAPTDGSRPQGWHGLSMEGRGQLEGRSATPAMFTTVLPRQPEIGGRMVVDHTGLTGQYDFLLKWTPEASLGASSMAHEEGVPPNPSAPSLFTALQEELGLRLEATKAPVDTIVIDSAEMPSQD